MPVFGCFFAVGPATFVQQSIIKGTIPHNLNEKINLLLKEATMMLVVKILLGSQFCVITTKISRETNLDLELLTFYAVHFIHMECNLSGTKKRQKPT